MRLPARPSAAPAAAAALLLLLAAVPSAVADGPFEEPPLELFEDYASLFETPPHTCRPGRFDSLLDLDAVIARAAEGLGLSERDLGDFSTGVAKSFSFGEDLCASLGSGTYKLLRVRHLEGEVRALFRLVPEEGVNYHDFVLVRSASGEVRAADIFLFLSGERLSQTFRRAMLPLAAHHNRSLLEKLSGSEGDFIAHLAEIQKLGELTRRGEAAAAMAVYKGLPVALQRDKNLLMMRYQLASALGEGEYEAAMAAIHKAFPDDPSLALVTLDYHLLREDFATARRMVEVLADGVGEDPYLDHLRSSIAYAAGDLEAAKGFAREAVESEPELEDPYWNLLTISLEQEEYAATARLLEEIEGKLGLEMNGVREAASYSGFVASPEGRTWLASREGL